MESPAKPERLAKPPPRRAGTMRAGGRVPSFSVVAQQSGSAENAETPSRSAQPPPPKRSTTLTGRVLSRMMGRSASTGTSPVRGRRGPGEDGAGVLPSLLDGDVAGAEAPITASPLFGASGLVLTQEDAFRSVFLPLEEEDDMPDAYLASVVLEYMRSLAAEGLGTEYFLEKFLIELLVKQGEEVQVHHLIQSGVIPPSVPTAMAILALRHRYAPAYYLGCDMLLSLGATDETVGVLLADLDVPSALRVLLDAGVDAAVAHADRVRFTAQTIADPILEAAVDEFFGQTL